MPRRRITRVARLAASTVLAAAVGPAMGQDAPKPPAPRSVQSPYAVNAPTPAKDASTAREEPLPPPRVAPDPPPPSQPVAVVVPPTSGAVPGPVPTTSWWKRCKAKFWASLGLESEFEPQPLGASVYATYRGHIANGDAARMVLYHLDFVDGSAALNTHGQDHVAKVAAMLTHNDFPVVVERTPSNPALAEARRLAVLEQLGRGGIALAPERIVIGPPIANGLQGSEAVIIYENLLLQTRERGLVTGAASGFVGGSSSASNAGSGAGGGSGSPPPNR